MSPDPATPQLYLTHTDRQARLVESVRLDSCARMATPPVPTPRMSLGGAGAQARDVRLISIGG